MDVKVCRECGKLFQYRGTYVCSDCIHEIDKKFTAVRDYIYKNPRATIDDICEDNDVTVDMVTSWLREGRLMVAEGAIPLLNCTSCGKPIASGRLCDGCANNIKSQVDVTSRELARDVERKRAEAEKRTHHF